MSPRAEERGIRDFAAGSGALRPRPPTRYDRERLTELFFATRKTIPESDKGAPEGRGIEPDGNENGFAALKPERSGNIPIQPVFFYAEAI